MKSIQQKFNDKVKLFIELYPDQYDAMVCQSKIKRDLIVKKTGAMKTDFIDRPICEVPVVIDEMMINDTSPDEYKIYTSKKFSRWIAKTYEAFRPIEEV